MSKVYYIKKISPENLIKIYEALGVKLPGKVGVKVSTGEDGAKGYLKADLIAPFVKSLNGTIVECNTAYPGKRNTAKDHIEVAKNHGFTSFAAGMNVSLPFSRGETDGLILEVSTETSHHVTFTMGEVYK